MTDIEKPRENEGEENNNGEYQEKNNSKNDQEINHEQLNYDENKEIHNHKTNENKDENKVNEEKKQEKLENEESDSKDFENGEEKEHDQKKEENHLEEEDFQDVENKDEKEKAENNKEENNKEKSQNDTQEDKNENNNENNEDHNLIVHENENKSPEMKHENNENRKKSENNDEKYENKSPEIKNEKNSEEEKDIIENNQNIEKETAENKEEISEQNHDDHESNNKEDHQNDQFHQESPKKSNLDDLKEKPNELPEVDTNLDQNPHNQDSPKKSNLEEKILQNVIDSTIKNENEVEFFVEKHEKIEIEPNSTKLIFNENNITENNSHNDNKTSEIVEKLLGSPELSSKEKEISEIQKITEEIPAMSRNNEEDIEEKKDFQNENSPIIEKGNDFEKNQENKANALQGSPQKNNEENLLKTSPIKSPIKSNDLKEEEKNVEEPKLPEQPKTLTLEDRIQQSKEFKDIGNKFFREKNYVEAIKNYETALSISHPNFFMNSDQNIIKEMIILTNILLNNLSYSFYNIGDFSKALKFADQVLMTDPKNVKSLYRKAMCYKELKDVERAFQNIKEARKNCYENKDNNPQVFQEYDVLKKEYEDYLNAHKEKEKLLYSKMLSTKSQIQEPKIDSSIQNKDVVKNDSLNSSTVQIHHDPFNYWFILPSSMSAFLISYLLKQNLKDGKGIASAIALSALLSGSTGFRNNWLKVLLATVSAGTIGMMYKRYI